MPYSPARPSPIRLAGLLLAAVGVAFLLATDAGRAVSGEPEDGVAAGGGDPAAEAPGPGESAGEDDGTDEPTGTEEPAPETPAQPDEPAPPKDGAPPGGPRGQVPEKKDFKEEEEEAPTPLPAQPEAEPLPISPDVLPGPAGMVLVPGGKVRIGLTPKELQEGIRRLPPNLQALFAHDTPQYETTLPTFWYGLYEVSNAQYYAFLQSDVRTYDTAAGGKATIEDVAREVWRVDVQEAKHPRYRASRQLYDGNREAIWQAFEASGRLARLVAKLPSGQTDEQKTFENMRYEALPLGVQLRYTPARPPVFWGGNKPPLALLSHPVRDISYWDCEAFAEWAGVHVQTEEEFEYCARGPELFRYPFGNVWALDTSRANWGAKITDERYEAKTSPVDSMPAGRSWMGAHHMAGNVAEWTSSWFRNYPGSSQNKNANDFLGEWVKVIRGGSAKDLETLVLQSSHRNWQKSEAGHPPYPHNRFEWVGFRYAAYREPGRDVLIPLSRRILERRKIREAWLDREKWMAASIRNWSPTGKPVENHVYITGPSTSIVFVPLVKLLFGADEGAPKDMVDKFWVRPNTLSKHTSIMKASETHAPLLVLGALHTDVGLTGLGLPRALTEKEQRDFEKAREKGTPWKPPTAPGGSIGPGSYALALWHNEITLLNPALEFLAFIPKASGQKWQYEPRRQKAAERKPFAFDMEAYIDEVRLQFDMPIGGKRADPRQYLAFNILLTFEASKLELLGEDRWQIHVPTLGADEDAAASGAEPSDEGVDKETDAEPDDDAAEEAAAEEAAAGK